MLVLFLLAIRAALASPWSALTWEDWSVLSGDGPHLQAERVDRIAFLEDLLANRTWCFEQPAEMMLRLSELYWEEAAHLERTGDPVMAQRFRYQTLGLDRINLAHYPSAHLSDLVRVDAIRAASWLGESSAAQAWLRELEARGAHPSAVASARLSLAGAAARDGAFEEAAATYAQALPDLPAEEVAYAHYQRAWCLRQLGRLGDAEAEMWSSLSALEQQGSPAALSATVWSDLLLMQQVMP